VRRSVAPIEDATQANDVLTLHEAAEELGVHYMSAYRYVRLGLLDAVKRGGIWNVERSAIEAFQAGSDRSPVAAGQSAPWSERLESRLIGGDAQGAWGVIEKALASGMELDLVYLEVLTPALVSIGERWSAGELDIAIEHRASGIAMRIIGQIGPKFVRRGRSRGVIVVASPAGEQHGLPLAMLSDLLRLEGWEVADLGANLPAPSLIRLMQDTPDAVAIGLSASSPESLAALTEMCGAVREAAPRLLVVLGGGAIQGRDHAVALGGHGWATTSEQMSDLIEAHLAALDGVAVDGVAAD
jgi:methanogenic corrinoid protein MtbC1